MILILSVQNGRVSPRKYSGQSEKSGASPAHHQSPGNQEQGNSSKSPPSDIPQKKEEEDDDDREMGTVPEKIDEGEEPPHRSVLPT